VGFLVAAFLPLADDAGGDGLMAADAGLGFLAGFVSGLGRGETGEEGKQQEG